MSNITCFKPNFDAICNEEEDSDPSDEEKSEDIAVEHGRRNRRPLLFDDSDAQGHCPDMPIGLIRANTQRTIANFKTIFSILVYVMCHGCPMKF